MPIHRGTAVLLTIAYVDQFNFPLTEEEISRRLIKVSLSKDQLRENLVWLREIGLIESRHQFWKLNFGSADWKTRPNREKISQKKWHEVEDIVRAVGWIPWIKGIAVTGSLAVNNVTPDGDIDLMIVVASRRLWLSRILVSLSTLWAGKRRTWYGNEKDSWCFNLWLDDQHLKLPQYKRNLYSAYEVCQAKWVLDKAEIKKTFYKTNSWVEDFLPHYFFNNYKNSSAISEFKSNKCRPAPVLRFIGRKFLDLLNLLIFIPQYCYMYPHMSREKVSLDSAYFHPRSTKGQIYQRWYNSLQQLWKK